jgi:prepilin-type N-terminal cleavage/methylation domain-containing protein
MRRSGFTLLEVLVALSLFAVGMLSVLQIFPLNRRFLKQSAQSTQAAFLAQEQMEKVVKLPYASLTTGSFQAATPASTTAGDPMAAFTEQTTVTLLTSTWASTATNVGLKRVDVLITWNERNIARQYTISTIVNEG